jgi:ribosome-associated heat shock protein Hsp15
MDGVRIDRWLCAARIFKSRTLAQQACVGGHVLVNGRVARPSHVVRVLDEVSALAPRGRVVLKVLVLAEKRVSPALARGLYEDHSPPPPPRAPEPVFRRERGAGRPTKADRRALARLRGL